MIYIFIGMPGSGKGTRAKVVSEKLNIPTISAGEQVRHSKDLTDRQRNIVNKGELLPAKEVNSLIFKRVEQDDCKNGYILDGYPRDTEQAKDLNEYLNSKGKKVDKVFVLTVDEDVIFERLRNRLSCKKCGAIYNTVGINPKKIDTCDVCGGELVRRDDDMSQEIIRHRFEEYNTKTAPIIKMYEEMGIAEFVDANKEPGEMLKHI